MPGISLNVFHVLTEAISFVTFVTKTVAFSTGDTVLSHITTLPFLSTELAFAHLCALSTRGILGNLILSEVVQNAICISGRSDNICR